MSLQAAVPRYVGPEFTDAPPGHRFKLYFRYWDSAFEPPRKDKLTPLREVCRLPEHAKTLMQTLAARGRSENSDTTRCIEARSTAPFTTGLGWEHPIENGFAFLDPYGLPYLPGSGVKGVLRRAAQELVTGDYGETGGWNDVTVNLLFGSEESDKPQHGALRFWDVIPELAGDRLEVDILNPHYRDYYQAKDTPHEAGPPVPVFFLTVPPKSTFRFRVDLIAPQRLTAELRSGWQSLIDAAFEHAFDWLGFGAKTAVGYGAMRAEKPARDTPEAAIVETVWEAVAVAYNVSTRDMTITHGGVKVIVREAKANFESLGSKTRQEKAKSGQLKADIQIRFCSDKPELLEILPPRP